MAKKINIIGGLGNATDDDVTAGVMYTSDNGIKRTGTNLPDATLSISGKAADAKAVGDRFIELEKRMDFIDEINECYGFVEHMDILSPSNRIEYIGVNEKYIPMSLTMSNTSSSTNYGSWANFPLLVENKPYMVKSTGEVDYQLDESNYDLKTDGTASDVANTAYDGGAFAKLIKVYVRRWIDGNDRHVRFSFVSLEGFTPAGFIDTNGSEMDHVWIPMFYGSTVDGKMRSLSGLQPDINQNTDAQFNSISAFSNRAAFFGGPIVETIKDILFMLFRTTDIQSACGFGNCEGYDPSSPPYYGVFRNAVVPGGKFYGTTDRKSLNKILHSIVIGSYSQYQRDPYLLCINRHYKVSTDYTYDLTGETYVDTGISSGDVESNRCVYPSVTKTVEGFGSLPTPPYNASSSTGYCDGVYIRADGNSTAVAIRFGDCISGSLAGPSSLALTAGAGGADWDLSASVLLRPPVKS